MVLAYSIYGFSGKRIEMRGNKIWGVGVGRASKSENEREKHTANKSAVLNARTCFFI